MEKGISMLQKFLDASVEFLSNHSFHAVIPGFCEKKKTDITLSKFPAGCIKVLAMVFAIHKALAESKITIPYPQQAVYLVNLSR
ncbi:MAG: hypothetical protein BWY42_00893 [Candidatus Omnitrophica bacterium ADurb.Bin277]|nr:MAG: hypothetical protein BWY42_00893 [Candidatus Omnitrophica bacterium ADurb.Bin277]